MKSSLIRCLLVIGIASTLSCQNQERVFPDFDYTTTYFPYKYPVRTLILGDYVFDNSNDNKLKFVISATMGGVYENKEEHTVQFVVDDSLTSNLYLGDKKILPLPRRYYTLSNPSEIVIPKGKLSGGVEVTLTPEFLADNASIGYRGTTYVIPLRIVSATTDSVLIGKTLMVNPDPRVDANWTTVPKNFTLFGINYVNEYHGNYLLRGASAMVVGTAVVETNVYRDKYVEKDEVVAINSSSRHGVLYSKRIVRSSVSSPGDFEALITFDESGNGAVIQTTTSKFPVKGTAKFVKNTESWGDKKHHAIYLDYQIMEGENIHNAKDTLVFRDKGVSFQEYTPNLK